MRTSALLQWSFSALALLASSMIIAQDRELPAVNACIVDFARKHEGSKVGGGECWDLAAGALNECKAKWNGFYDFGKLIEWKRYEVYPGDIVQFENVEVEHREGNAISRERYGQHTAIVIAVHGRGDYEIAHQNMQPVGKKVSTGVLRMADVRSGKLTFYRPLE